MNSAWDQAFPECIHDAAGRRVTQRMRWGLRALTTLPWAQDVGHDAQPEALLRVLKESTAPLVVLDLPAGMVAEVPAGHPAWALTRHTRQLTLHSNTDPVEAWPAHRRKQIRRAEREGMTPQRTQDVALMVDLHQRARHRKGLHSDGAALEQLLQALLLEEHTHAWVVRNADGQPLAGGVFHRAEDERCIYGFGGQVRGAKSGVSSRASVMLLGAAMRHAASTGCTTFDFGGSQDAGVDRFYAEFGAAKVDKVKWVQIRGIWKALLRWRRPDLFPR